MKKGHLIVISGPSGVGKGTVRKQLFKNKNLNLAYSISFTTRKPRAKEKNGIDYYYVNTEEFLKYIQEDKFLEYAQFVENYYGTPSEYVDNLISQGKNVVLEIEVVGAQKVIEKRPDAITIFLMPPSLEDLEKRIISRKSESPEVMKKRLTKAIAEIECKNQYQYVVVNDSVENATNKIVEIIKQNI